MEMQFSRSKGYFLKGIIFFYFASIGVLLPFLPVYFQHKGFSIYQIGLLMAIGPLVSLSLQSLWGFLSDRFATVKWIILLQLFVSLVVSRLLFSVDTFGLLAACMFFFFAFAWPVIPLLDSLTLGTAKAAGEQYGTYRVFGSVGFALTALGAGKLFTLTGIESMRHVYMSLLLVCILLCLLIGDNGYSGKPPGIRHLGALIRRREVISFLLVITLLSLTNKANDSFMSIYIKYLGGTEADAGLAWTVAPISEAPIFALAGAFMGRYHELALLALASAAFTLRWVLFVLVSDPKILIVVQLLHSVSFGLFFLSAISYMTRLVPDRLRASGQGLLSSFMGGIAGVIGSLAGGIIISSFGPRWLYGTCALLTAVACLIFYCQYRKGGGIERASDLDGG